MTAPGLIRWDAPGPYEIAFSTREGGVSEGDFASLNLGILTEDEPEAVEENRRRVLESLGARELVLNHQQHGALVVDADPEWPLRQADGLVTDVPGRALLALAADCVPVALARAGGDAPAVGVVHAGWRGLVAGVVGTGVAALGGRVGAAIGPAIGPCCYEVGEDVAAAFRAAFGPGVVHGRTVDLPGAAERALRDAGVREVERHELCTACNPELFFSHRRDAGRTGRQGVIAVVAA